MNHQKANIGELFRDNSGTKSLQNGNETIEKSMQGLYLHPILSKIATKKDGVEGHGLGMRKI